MKIKLSKKQWELIGKTAGWDSNYDDRMDEMDDNRMDAMQDAFLDDARKAYDDYLKENEEDVVMTFDEFKQYYGEQLEDRDALERMRKEPL